MYQNIITIASDVILSEAISGLKEEGVVSVKEEKTFLHVGFNDEKQLRKGVFDLLSKSNHPKKEQHFAYKILDEALVTQQAVI